MGTVAFYIFYALNWLVTFLPLPVLYWTSDFAFLFMYHFPGYRRKVVRDNLRNSFPEKDLKEIIAIEKKYYHHLCDLFIETLKLTHMSDRELLKRMHLKNPELLERLYQEGRDVTAIMGHYGNWEWLASLPLVTKYSTVSIYKPLADRNFDRLMMNLRSRDGMTVTPMSHIVREIIENKRKNIRSLYSFIADQTPPKIDIKFWTTFLNQETGVYLGAEKIASKYDMAVVFFHVEKLKRGYYTYEADLLFEHSSGTKETLITETHVRRLEEIIRANPEYWVWSHRRWKYKNDGILD